MDDEYLSLISLARLCGSFKINPHIIEILFQCTLSIYLLVQSKLRLRHSLMSMIDIIPAIQRVYKRHRHESMITNRAMMTFVYRRIVVRVRVVNAKY